MTFYINKLQACFRNSARYILQESWYYYISKKLIPKPVPAPSKDIGPKGWG